MLRYISLFLSSLGILTFYLLKVDFLIEYILIILSLPEIFPDTSFSPLTEIHTLSLWIKEEEEENGGRRRKEEEEGGGGR